MSMTNALINRLRDFDNCNSLDTDAAADMLEFFFWQMQATSPTMDGNSHYRFRSGWPMSFCVGHTALDAARNAVAELKRERSEADAQNDIDNAPESV